MTRAKLEVLASSTSTPKASLRKLSTKDSVVACLFLSLYVGTYMAAGFVGITAIAWAWQKLIG